MVIIQNIAQTMNKLVLLLDDLLAVSKCRVIVTAHAQKTVQTMSNEDVAVESSNVLLL